MVVWSDSERVTDNTEALGRRRLLEVRLWEVSPDQVLGNALVGLIDRLPKAICYGILQQE